MADIAVGYLLENLQHVLTYKDDSIVDINAQVQGLKNDLIRFKAFLRDTTVQRSDTESRQAIVNSISSVVYKAEDAIDKLVVQKAKFKEKDILRKALGASGHSTAIQNVANEIESLIKIEVKQIYDQKMLEHRPEKVAIEKKPPPEVEKDNVVGFDEEAETIIKRFNGENVDLDIMTITGMPGLGKTTLARKIFDDPAIEYEFFTRAWVYVSERYKKRDVYINILSTIKQEDYSSMSDDTISKELYNFLDKGKYLIVMDDVWTEEAWNDLKNVFPNNKKGSRILITSRHQYVAKYANPDNGTHDLKFLTQDESWELLKSKVFGKGKSPPKDLEILGQHIAAKCNGLPLAIVVIAGILFNDRESSEWWNMVAENANLLIVRKEEEFMKVIAVSYDHLPYYLKSCFLYLGVFPEDYEIPVGKLIRLWIAEGFIERDGELTLEDIAEVYITELVNRSLLMVSQRRSNGQIKTCHVHDMMSDFCRKEAARQNLYHEIKSNFSDCESYRRVCIHSNVIDYIKCKPQAPHLRSFLCFPRDEITMPNKHIGAIPKAFELLRVLDVKSIILEMFPKELLQLALLRYLVLSCNIKVLPKSISQLWNMQSLMLFTTFPKLDVKEEIWKMYQLRHLHTNASAVLPCPSHNIQNAKESIQSLSMISPESCTEQVFARTRNIKKLGVRGNVTVLFDKLFDNVMNLQHLTNLKLHNDRKTYEGKVLNLPQANKFPKTLKRLTLSNTFLDWGQMQILGNLEKLELLKLKENAFKGEIWDVKDGGFLSLKLLHIGRTDLVTWKASMNHFPCLIHLVLKHCEKLVEVPYGFAEISSFQVLELYRTNPSAAHSARRIHGKKMIKAVKGTNSSNSVFKYSVYPPDNLSFQT